MGVILPVLVSRFGWRSSWYVLGGSMFFLVFINAVYCGTIQVNCNSPLGATRGAGSHRQERKDIHYREILSLRLFWIIGLSYLFVAVRSMPFKLFSNVWVTELGISHSVASGSSRLCLHRPFGGADGLHISDRSGGRKPSFSASLPSFCRFLD